jgi:diguanylate cyclase (GGDEF)-like protein
MSGVDDAPGGTAAGDKDGKSPRAAWLRMPGVPWGRQWLHHLEPEDRARLTATQVAATRPAFTAILLGGAAMLAIAAVLQALDATGGIGYPAWLVAAAAAAVAALAVGNLCLRSWQARLAGLLVAMVVTGVFLSVPLPGALPPGGVPLRSGLFYLMSMALLALTVRPVSVALVVAAVVALAMLRLALQDMELVGEGFYWLHVAATIGFGFMLSGYRSDFAIEAYQVRRSLWKQAATDALTGLANRAGWDRDAVPVYADAGARGAARSLVFFAVDHFKDVNDRMGHAYGDEVLRRLGQVLAARVGPDGYAARMGGEEFIALLIDAPPAAVQRFAQRVREDFATIAGNRPVTLSAGIAFASPAEPLGEALRRADDALYAAKQGGRDRIAIAAVDAPGAPARAGGDGSG